MATDARSIWLQRLVAAAGLVLVAVTWRLWTPQVLFPQVPLFRFLANSPGWLDWIGLALLVGGLIAALVSRHDTNIARAGLLLFVFATAALVLIDQHRLQPWAYQLGIAAIVLACAPRDRAQMLLQVVTISIYVHSGLSKLDFSFLETNGQQLVGALLDAAGLSQKFWSDEMRRTAAAILPIGELLVAVGLAIPQTRRWGMFASFAMHGLLLIALGPWGLNHQPAVLVWNVYFMLQNWLLFGGSREAVTTEETRWSQRFAELVVAAVVVLPLLEPWGRFDVWPSWAVYTAHPAKIRIYVENRKPGELPDQVEEFVSSSTPYDQWRYVSIDRWSLESLHVPIYPQDRFQLAVAIALAGTIESKDGIRVVIEERADRWTGKRNQRELIGRAELQREAGRFWVNAEPRHVAQASPLVSDGVGRLTLSAETFKSNPLRQRGRIRHNCRPR